MTMKYPQYVPGHFQSLINATLIHRLHVFQTS